MSHVVRCTNPKSRWPYRIVRVHADGSTHKLLIKFANAERAQAYIDKYADRIDRFA